MTHSKHIGEFKIKQLLRVKNNKDERKAVGLTAVLSNTLTEAVAGPLGTWGHFRNFPPVGPNGYEYIFDGTGLFGAWSDSSHFPDKELIAKVQNQF